MKKYKGCVYFIKHKGLTPIKIGMSNADDLNTRMSSYKTCSPYGIEIIGTIPTDKALELEKEIHFKLSSFRLNGEWFEISLDMVNSYIEMYTNHDTIELRNKIELQLNNSSKKNEENNVDNSFVNKYSQSDKGNGFIVLNIKEICLSNNIDTSNMKFISRFIKSKGFKYKTHSYKGTSKKGFKLFLV